MAIEVECFVKMNSLCEVYVDAYFLSKSGG